MNYEEMIYIALAIVILLNLYTTYKVFKSDYYENVQKIIQVMIVWFLPIIGFFVVLYFLTDNSGGNNDNSESGGTDTSYTGSGSGGGE